ncbi:MAG: sel1 repeat family protein [Planctomycetes bacterium]|nr:sel1 repeat family protein [Planctomycetota bacterium]
MKEGRTKEALVQLHAAWVRGDVDSAVLMGDIHHEGRGVSPDRIVARDLYRRAGERGHTGAMIALAKSLKLRRPDEAKAWFQRAARANSGGQGLLGLADLVRAKARTPEDLSRARDLFNRAGRAGAGDDAAYGIALVNLVDDATPEGVEVLRTLAIERNHAYARIAYARILTTNTDPALRRGAIRVLKEGAAAGQGICLAQLGVLYEQGGEFLEKDPAQALECFQKSAALNTSEGMLSLFRLLPKGDEATAWLRRAAALEDPHAQLYLGLRAVKSGKVAEGLELIDQAAQAKQPKALAFLGEVYSEGKLAPRDLSRSDGFLEAAARAGDPPACHNLALQYEAGKRRKKDLLRAEAFFEKAAKRGVRQSIHRLARLLADRGQTERAVLWWRRGVEARDVDSILALANLLVDGKVVKRDTKAALKLYEAGAALGAPFSAHMSAMMLERGIGVEKKDLAKAASYYTAAAEGGEVPSMIALAEILATGRGVPKDPAKSEEWYALAIKSTEPPGEGLFERGLSYAQGSGLAYRPALAVALYERALKVGHREAQLQLAIHLCLGEGAPLDAARAVEMFEELSQAGMAAATLTLGKCYGSGTGVPKDLERAKALMLDAQAASPKLAKAVAESLRDLEAKPASPRRKRK